MYICEEQSGEEQTLYSFHLDLVGNIIMFFAYLDLGAAGAAADAGFAREANTNSGGAKEEARAPGTTGERGAEDGSCLESAEYEAGLELMDCVLQCLGAQTMTA
jgi:hypothetical protein